MEKTSKKSRQTQRAVPIAILLGSLVIALAIILYAFMQFLSTKSPKQPNQQQAFENISYVTTAKSPTMGKTDAPVVVIEYTDFDCPVCETATQIVLPDLRREYIETGKVKFIFKSLPLTALHSNAFRKTEAAYCARDQGGDDAFFRYYDALFTDIQFSLRLDDALVSLAKKHNLDEYQFTSCLTERKYKSLIDAEILEGNLIGSLGTPTWLIAKSDGDGIRDAVKINGLIEYGSFRTIIETLLAQ